jgi:thiol-disulfide isomerase/thioredoxin
VKRALATIACVLAVGCNNNNTPSPKPSISGDGPGATTATSTTTSTSTSTSATSSGPKLMSASQDTDALTAIRTERLKAKADGRVLVVYVSATWCEPCKRFKEELSSGRLDERLSKVTLLAFDADKDLDRLGAAGYTFKFVPFVALPGADGRPSDSQEATGKGSSAWRELLGKLDAWQAPPK